MGLDGADVVHVEPGRPIAIVGPEIQGVRGEGVACPEPHAQKNVYARSEAEVASGRALQRPLAQERIDVLKEEAIGRRESTVHKRIPVWTKERLQDVVNEIIWVFLQIALC